MTDRPIGTIESCAPSPGPSFSWCQESFRYHRDGHEEDLGAPAARASSPLAVEAGLDALAVRARRRLGVVGVERLWVLLTLKRSGSLSSKGMASPLSPGRAVGPGT